MLIPCQEPGCCAMVMAHTGHTKCARHRAPLPKKRSSGPTAAYQRDRRARIARERLA
jgi:hypothetical protein